RPGDHQCAPGGRHGQLGRRSRSRLCGGGRDRCSADSSLIDLETNMANPNVARAGLGGLAPAGPQSRYILPSFIEHSCFGVKESNPYNKLFEERIIFLGVQVDDASANDIMAQLLVLESLDPDRDITMYINSPGG